VRRFRTERRLDKISKVARNRQPSLFVVLENIHDPHNVSAIYRTCDAVGAPVVGLLYTQEAFPKISKITSASARKWVDTQRYISVDACYSELRAGGFKILATVLDESAQSIYNLDLTGRVAVILGNEHRGVSDEAAEKADAKIYIPMRGMIQSLNVSVAAAVTLFEVQRQRNLKGMYPGKELSESEINKLIDKWAYK
jgi:tRNA (guanosine-2'-O-)-methyltransferase